MPGAWFATNTIQALGAGWGWNREWASSATLGSAGTAIISGLATLDATYTAGWCGDAPAHDSATWPTSAAYWAQVDVAAAGGAITYWPSNALMRFTAALEPVAGTGTTYSWTPTSGTGIKTLTAPQSPNLNTGTTAATDRFASAFAFQTSNIMSSSTLDWNTGDVDAYAGHPSFANGGTWTGPADPGGGAPARARNTYMASPVVARSKTR